MGHDLEGPSEKKIEKRKLALMRAIDDRLIGEDFTERRQELIRKKALSSDQYSELLRKIK